MRQNLIFRSWFYFRQGWSIYFAFILAAINTMVTTYYLAIERVSFLKSIFPSFALYVLLVASIAIPILVIIGYIHTKKSAAYKSEADVAFESNPHMRRMLINTEMILNLHLELNKIIMKLSKNEKLTNEEIEKINSLQKELVDYMSKKSFG